MVKTVLRKCTGILCSKSVSVFPCFPLSKCYTVPSNFSAPSRPGCQGSGESQEMSRRVTEAILKEICPERKRGDSLAIPGLTFVLFMP